MRILKIVILCGLARSAAPAPAAPPTPAAVVITNFKFTPSIIALRSGVPTVLSLRNQSGSGHSFSSPAFFAVARMDPKSAAYVHNGKVEVPARSEVDLSLTPVAGASRNPNARTAFTQCSG